MSAPRLCQACGERNAAEVTLCRHCKKPVIDPALHAAGWREILARPRLPASWPAVAGLPKAGATCHGCGNARWYRVGDGIVCGTCHPPDERRRVEWIEAGGKMEKVA